MEVIRKATGWALPGLEQLGKAWFDTAMLAALAGEKALAADETSWTAAPRSPPRGKQEEQDPEERRRLRARRTC